MVTALVSTGPANLSELSAVGIHTRSPITLAVEPVLVDEQSALVDVQTPLPSDAVKRVANSAVPGLLIMKS